MGKKIILFADGTGNAFSTQESNVWRLFEALDTSSKDQLAYYIEGVGTSSFRPWAIFDGATGIGVPSNVRKLYRFLCWNWEQGDEIYMFGFSRGAFTIRTLIGLIRSEGLVAREFEDGPVSHAGMQRNAMAAWRAYRSKGILWYKSSPIVGITRLLRDLCLAVWNFSHRPRYGEVVNQTREQGRDGGNISIKFAGLFDTVEAFGVPIAELRGAIDKLIWPISFRNSQISDKVQTVRHALSLDDERTTFHPLRIDKGKRIPGFLETTITQMLTRLGVNMPTQQILVSAPDRVREVWFAGVHSDVGGGYPDDELARVPLMWMLEELEATDTVAQQAGNGGPKLRFREGALDDFRKAASPFGTLHDSRAGSGVFYRYSPRRIEWTIDGRGTAIHDVVVHPSVIQRILHGSDRYAPLTLPSDAVVWTPREKDTPIHAYLDSQLEQGGPIPAPNQLHSKACLDRAWDLVWVRQATYFLMLGTVLGLAFIPILGTGNSSDNQGSSSVLGEVVEALKNVTPSYVDPYLDALHSHPIFVVVLVVAAWILYTGGNALRDTIHDNVRQAWMPPITQPREQNPLNPFPWVGHAMRRIGSSLPWLGPSLSNSLGLLAVIVVVIAVGAGGVVLASRARFNFRLGNGSVCNSADKRQLIEWNDGPIDHDFTTNQPCWSSGRIVEKGIAYRLTITIEEPWFDQLVLTDVEGFESDTFERKIFKTPLLRWPTAGWFQPIARIGADGDVEWPVVSNDGSGPIQRDDARCTRIPIHFDQTPEFCAAHPNIPCDQARADLSKKLGGWKEPLSGEELLTAKKVWQDWQEHKCLQNDCLGPKQCEFAYPRTTLAADFVARKTGELFLFVNDAMPLLWQSDDAYYHNNLGTAKIALTRAPLAAPGVAIRQGNDH